MYLYMYNDISKAPYTWVLPSVNNYTVTLYMMHCTNMVHLYRLGQAESISHNT